VCFDSAYNFSLLILKKTERDMIIYVYRSACEVPLFLLGFNET